MQRGKDLVTTCSQNFAQLHGDSAGSQLNKENAGSNQQENTIGEEKTYVLWYAKACAKFSSVELEVSLW